MPSSQQLSSSVHITLGVGGSISPKPYGWGRHWHDALPGSWPVSSCGCLSFSANPLLRFLACSGMSFVYTEYGAVKYLIYSSFLCLFGIVLSAQSSISRAGYSTCFDWCLELRSQTSASYGSVPAGDVCAYIQLFFPLSLHFFFFFSSQSLGGAWNTHSVEQCEHMGHPFAYSFLLLAA